MLKRKIQRVRTVDRGDATGFHTVEQVGATRAFTPEGFLLCMEVPIARLGTMLYMGGEVPVPPGQDGLVRITRDERALFSDEAISSYNGKPVVNEHPDVDVTPANWRVLSVGTVMNPRRGEGENCDVVVADLLITDPRTIEDILAGKREVSAGYEADYEQTGVGEGRQTSIIGNHVALVEKGRCGPRCAIGDHDPSTSKGNTHMPTSQALKRRATIAGTLRRVFKDAEEDLNAAFGGDPKDDADGDDDGQKEDPPAPAPAGGGDGHTHIHIHTAGSGEAPGAAPAAAAPAAADPNADKTAGDLMGDGMDDATPDDPMEQRFVALEAGLAKLTAVVQKLVGGEAGEGGAPAPVGEGDQQTRDGVNEELEDGQGSTAPAGKTTMDSAALATSFQQLLADAEVLVPGFRAPTFDAAKPRKTTMDSMCALRRSVLDSLVAKAAGASLLASAAPSLQLQKASCVDVAGAFSAAAAAQRALNNAAATKDSSSVPAPQVATTVVGKVKSVADLNAFYAQHYAGKK